MRLITLALSAALLGTTAASAATPGTTCRSMIESTSKRLSEIGKAVEGEGNAMSENQHKAVTAALDAARLVEDEDQNACVTLAGAAHSLVMRGELAGTLHGEAAIMNAEEWNYDTLYKDTWRASALIDLDAYNAEGESVGEIHDILVRPDGTIDSVIIEGGGFLDIGDSHVRVKWDEMKFRDGAEKNVIVPLDPERLTDFSLFDDSENAGPRADENLVRMSTMLHRTVRLSDGSSFGYVDDYLVTDGRIASMVVRPDIRFGNSRHQSYATPYDAHAYGYSPGYDFYILPYSEKQMTELGDFEIDRVSGPNARTEPGKGS